MPEYTSEIMQVGRLLANPVVIEVPSFQRSFAWKIDQAGTLLDDILTALDETEERGTSEYFLGAMLFTEREPTPPARSRLPWPRPRPRSSALRTLEVIDGLQRLTTITILLCVLRDLEAGPGRGGSPHLLGAIQSGRGANAQPRLSLSESEDAFFQVHVRALGATRRAASRDGLLPSEVNILDVRDDMVATLANCESAERRRLVDFLLDRCCVVLVATTGIDRAHRMFTVLNARGKPLLRNDILKAILLGKVPREGARTCQAVWKEAEDRLGEQFESLFSHIRVMYGRSGGQVISNVLEIADANGGPQLFIERILGPASVILHDIRSLNHTGSAESGAIAERLRYLGQHSFSDWIPPTILWWLQRGRDAPKLERFLARLDRLAFCTRVLGIGGSKRGRRFGSVVAAIREGRDPDGAGGALELSRQEVRTIQHNLRDLHARNPSAAKQLLLRLADMEAGAPQSLSLPDDMSVEHVLPRTLRPNSQWREWYPDPEEREQCTESLGNLMLVTKAQNDKASNLDLASKLKVYFETRGAPKLAINEALRGRTEWKAADVRAREMRLFELIESSWELGIPPAKVQAAE